MYCYDKINDYIYLRALEDILLDGVYYEKGSIIRLDKTTLERRMWSKYLDSNFFEDVGIIFNKRCGEDEFLPYKKYKSIYIRDDISIKLKLEKNSLCYCDRFLSNHSSSLERVKHNGLELPKYIINMAEVESKTSRVDDCSNYIFSKNHFDGSKIRRVIDDDGLDLYLDFNGQELLDFSCINVNLLFLNQNLIDTLNKCSIIKGKEKKNLFLIDFDMFNKPECSGVNIKNKKLVISK